MIRLWRLYAVLNRNTMPMATWKLLAICLLPATGIILGGIIRESALPCVMISGGHLDQVYVLNGELVSHTTQNALIQTCCLCTDWQFGLFAYCFAFYFLIIAGAFLLRNVRQSFNELRETTVTTIGALLAFVLTAITAFLPWGGTCAGRNVNTLVTMISISIPTFMIAGPWVAGRLMDPAGAEARFWAQMKAESQSFADRGRPASTTDVYSMHSSSSSLDMSAVDEADRQAAPASSSSSTLPYHASTTTSSSGPPRPKRQTGMFNQPSETQQGKIIVPPLQHGRGGPRGLSGPLSPRHPTADDDSFVSLTGSMK